MLMSFDLRSDDATIRAEESCRTMGSRVWSIWRSVRDASIARQASVAAGIALLGATSVGMVASGDAFSGTAPAGGSTRLAPPSDPDSLFDARSPGVRRYGWLTQSKGPRAGFAEVSPESPVERVLTSVRRRPGPPVAPTGGTPLNIPYAAIEQAIDPSAGPADAGLVLAETGPGGTGGSIGTPGTGIGGVLPGGGGGGGGGTGGGGTTPGTGNPQTPAVPEPTTWAMLVLGFFGIGAAMRQRRPLQIHGAR